MNVGPGYFEIQADDTARAVRFYSEVFGWSLADPRRPRRSAEY
jgi:predicted enzyme related to lactoylglutathione lyase